ncbi:hypothetical protein HDIA_0502 [Hartmannibacter diazotrophicus]|uniref:Uncharacterized protein n=1 Tax=Hartmannibacter diazotrophicus TaxID=1482074 RepID=A0A2C9D1E0_9HYPH|nr:hypothetical protein HDIA_0502 [Hartmannibacter diazotrophicus]
MAIGKVLPDRACDDVARSQFGALDTLKKTPAGLVDDRCPFAANGLADERHRTGGAVKCSRMELDELQVGHDRAGTGGEREALAAIAEGVRGVAIESTDPARCENDAPGGQEHRPGRGGGHHTRDPAVFQYQPACLDALDDGDRR